MRWCWDWALQGECFLSRPFMARHCSASCGFCVGQCFHCCFIRTVVASRLVYMGWGSIDLTSRCSAFPSCFEKYPSARRAPHAGYFLRRLKMRRQEQAVSVVDVVGRLQFFEPRGVEQLPAFVWRLCPGLTATPVPCCSWEQRRPTSARFPTPAPTRSSAAPEWGISSSISNHHKAVLQ